MSSIRVERGYLVVLYENADFKGAYTNVKADMPYIGNAWNDRVSSIEVYSGKLR